MRRKAKSIAEVFLVWDFPSPRGLIHPPLKVQLLPPCHHVPRQDKNKGTRAFRRWGGRGWDALQRSPPGLRVASPPRKARPQTAILVPFRVGGCRGPAEPHSPTGVPACAGGGLHVPSAMANSVFITRSVLNWEVNRAPSDKR